MYVNELNPGTSWLLDVEAGRGLRMLLSKYVIHGTNVRLFVWRVCMCSFFFPIVPRWSTLVMESS